MGVRYMGQPIPSITFQNHPVFKIAFIAPFLYRYQRGIERSCTHLANALAELNQDVTIITWNQHDHQTPSPIDPRIPILRVPNLRYYQSKWAALFYSGILLRNHFDVIVIFFAGYGEAQALHFGHSRRQFQICFIAGYPIEQVPHRFKEFKSLHIDQILDHIVVKSPSMAPAIGNFFNRMPAVIPNGIDTNLFRKRIK